MDKVYAGCIMVDENELDIMLDSLKSKIYEDCDTDEHFDNLTKLYVKLLKEKEDIQRERAKYESKTQSI